MSEVLIIGGGPAGLAAAITLRQQGILVTLVYQKEKGPFKVGESLSGSARLSLERLGVWDSFVSDQHAPCFGNSACWGSGQLHYYPFLHTLYGHGWHIDRLLFEQRLWEAAENLGVVWIERDKTAVLQWQRDHWQYTQRHQSTTASWLLDASGRNSWVARQLHLDRAYEDQQIAVIAFLKALDSPLKDRSSLVEAVPYGWWYSAPLNDGYLVCTFFTDPDLYKNHRLHTPTGWQNALFATRFTFERIAAGRYELLGPPQLTGAESSRLGLPIGDYRIAAGDAAISFDPLSAHGISLALVSGIDAAQAIIGQMNGDPTAFSHYEQQLNQAFQHYSQERLIHYRREQRWPENPYWKRRH